MNFNEAMQMLGTKLQGKYGHLGFKYKKSDKTLTRHSKNFTYMIAFSSFVGNTKDSISIEVCYIINTRVAKASSVCILKPVLNGAVVLP